MWYIPLKMARCSFIWSHPSSRVSWRATTSLCTMLNDTVMLHWITGCEKNATALVSTYWETYRTICKNCTQNTHFTVFIKLIRTADENWVRSWQLANWLEIARNDTTWYEMFIVHWNAAHCARRRKNKEEKNTHTHTQPLYCWSGICPGPPGSAGTRKVKPRRLKPIWIYWSKR